MEIAWEDHSFVSSGEACNFLVVAALQEELNEFYKLNNRFSKPHALTGGVMHVKCTRNKKPLSILTYASDKMGMPYNAAAIMKVINLYKPHFTLFIGTCAGLINSKRECGDVLVPMRVFSYESGKYKDGKFLPDHLSYETGDTLRKQARIVYDQWSDRKFKVFTDENFCSGAAVINDITKRNEITQHADRKVTGLDMESYAIACINDLLKPEKELLVVKGISDFAIDKDTSEASGCKEIAMKNSATFALKLIYHLQKTFFDQKSIKLSSDSGDALSQILKVKEVYVGSEMPPYGKLISLKGLNNLFVSSEDGAKSMTCSRTAVGQWEQFRIIDAGDGKFALQNNGKYVSSENGIQPMKCDRTKVGDWEKFEWNTIKGKLVIKGSNNHFISIEKTTGSLICNATDQKSSEKFSLLSF